MNLELSNPVVVSVLIVLGVILFHELLRAVLGLGEMKKSVRRYFISRRQLRNYREMSKRLSGKKPIFVTNEEKGIVAVCQYSIFNDALRDMAKKIEDEENQEKKLRLKSHPYYVMPYEIYTFSSNDTGNDFVTSHSLQ